MSFTLKKWLFLVIIPVFITVFLIGFVIYSAYDREIDTLVTTNTGMIQGLIADDGDYNMFLGVPYATVNKSNVFGPAIPQAKFDQLYHANDDSIICPQYDYFSNTVKGDLDCLRLNIYVPHTASRRNLLPVLIYITGDQYETNVAQKNFLGPKYLMKKDIILIMLHYRVGPYGFLCANNPDISSNEGLKDQMLAFKWIKQNVKEFGGDPMRITLAGFGSGGENVNFHLLFGREQFQSIIIDSGINREPKEHLDNEIVLLELAEHLGLYTNNELEALRFLNIKDPKEVIETSKKLAFTYHSCIEREMNNAFLTNETIQCFVNNIKKTPILIINSENDMLPLYHYNDLNKSRDLFSKTLKDLFEFRDDKHFDKMETDVRNFYIGDNKINDSLKYEIIKYWSDVYSNFPTKLMIEKYIDNGARNVYYGIFSYPGERSYFKVLYNLELKGATRGDLSGYLFDMPIFKKTLTKEEQKVVDVITTLWANVVKYGNPTPEKSKTIPVKWEPVEKQKLSYMNISSTLKSMITPFRNRTAFWDKFYKMNFIKRLDNEVEPWI